MITEEVIASFLSCKYKSYLKFHSKYGHKTDYEILEHEMLKLYRERFYNGLKIQAANFYIGEIYDLKNKDQFKDTTYMIQIFLKSEIFNIMIDALQILIHKDSGRNLYIPIMVSPKEKISNTEKVLLSAICLILYELKGIDSDFAKIVYGYNLKSEKVNISVYLKEAKGILRELLDTVKN